ncbi:hypothetical protein M9Y10_011697 [Tritrichomonas musculus]|uniref:Uncharacterized protein n=1 Tax=Tritrichomonas musculus TaxID=1915356 RepID=A0ABR2IK09_9EUKA
MKNYTKKQPPLATANCAFTPMTHHSAKPPQTPFTPLKVDDLDTPVKMNKSNSSADVSELSSQRLFPNSHTSNIQDASLDDLRLLLMNALTVIDTLQKQNKETNKSYKSVQTQTQAQSSIQAIPKPPRPTEKIVPPALANRTKKYNINRISMAENTEVIINDESVADIGSPENVQIIKKRTPLTPKSGNIPSDTERLTLDGSPISAKKSSDSNLSNKYNFSSSGSKKSDDDLQERMRAMSLLLRNLENQLDNIF